MTLEARGVTFGYTRNVPVVHGIDLRIGDGEMLCILGPNGSGKSTILRLLSGSLKPSEGTVRLDGREMGAVPRKQAARRISFLPQEVSYAFDYLAEEVVAMGRYPHLRPFEWGNGGHAEVVGRSMEVAGIHGLRNRPYSELSGGEKRMVDFARSLAQEPSVLMLDEPTRDLDLRYSHRLLGTVRGLNRKDGLTVIAVLHDLSQAMRYFDRFILVGGGRIENDGRAKDVISASSIESVFGVRASVDHDAMTIIVEG